MRREFEIHREKSGSKGSGSSLWRSTIYRGVVLTFIALMLLPSVSTQAQELKELLEKVRQTYSDANRLHIKMHVKVYEGTGQDAEKLLDQVADIKKQATNYHYSFGEIRLLMNTQYQVVVDELSKKIMVASRDPSTEEQLADPFQMNLDSIFRLYDNPVLESSEDDMRTYRLDQSEGPISSVKLTLNTRAYTLKELSYTYRGGQYAVIEFLVFDIQPKFDAGEFQESKYVQLRAGTWHPATRLPGYEVIMN